jgi:CubicO group peptidase (beta-lactamase class C family)
MKIFLTAVMIGLFSSVQSQEPDYKAIDSVVRSYAKNGVFSGVVLLADKGVIRYEKAFGYRDFAKRVSVHKTDVFELASVSKQFTAMVIMMLKEKGLLGFDDLVEKYIDIPYKGITIRHLLTHTSGLPDYQAIMDAHWDKSKVAGNPDIIEYLKRYAPPKRFEPGAKYEYSNTGYVMLASIAEKASRRDFIEFATAEIFDKLGMARTRIRSLQEKAAVPDFALGHVFVADKKRFIRVDSFPSTNYMIWLGNRKGPGRISSTAEDLLKWDQVLYTEKLVRHATLDEAFAPMVLTNGKISYYGFGWMIIPVDNKNKVVWHAGDNPGYRTLIRRFLRNRKTMIILCNNGYDGMPDMVDRLVALFTK